MIGLKLRVGSSDGPIHTVIGYSKDAVQLDYNGILPSGTKLYSVDGYEVMTLGATTSTSSATFYESRTEQQAIDEDGVDKPDFGWRFKHLGWQVPFEEGTSAYGSLISLQLNRQGVGTEGPTSITGSNGRPLALLQGTTITNLATQVNGWKTSTDGTGASTYNLEADALSDEDDDYFIYADAYISWSGETQVVSTPGSDMVDLEEYSPTNTVEVEI